MWETIFAHQFYVCAELLMVTVTIWLWCWIVEWIERRL